MALFASTTLPSTLCGLTLMAASTSFTGICDTIEASGVPDVWIPHYHTGRERFPLLKMASQTLSGCFKAQSSDEELPQLLGSLGDSDLDMIAVEWGDIDDAY